MSLMFQRLAHNFAKNGYYPTDSETIARILSAITACEKGQMRILDPCSGEGVALAECKRHLGDERTKAFSIEYDEERAWHAKELLDVCIHSDLQSCVIGKRSFGLLFLNPPYGDLVADKMQTEFVQKGRQRLEKLFYQLTAPSLQFGGVLALVIPHYSLDSELAQWIANAFDRVEVFLAPEQGFKQIVVFGIRAQRECLKNVNSVKAKLIKVGEGELPPELPAIWEEPFYSVPEITHPDVIFFSSHLDARQLESEIMVNPCLWKQFEQQFSNIVQPYRQPLMPLSQWHLALSLAAGQVTGVVHSSDKRTFVIKGDTHKEVEVKTSFEETAENEVTEVTTHLEKFVAVIRAIDMTAKSTTFGDVITIR